MEFPKKDLWLISTKVGCTLELATAIFVDLILIILAASDGGFVSFGGFGCIPRDPHTRR